ncbi:MAG: ATP-dependent DNA helicase RecQ, partial [Rhodothermales bacterium]
MRSKSQPLEQAQAALRRFWGHPGFRPGQREVIEAVLAGRDVLAILPTGGGKSVCYQVPALLRDGLTLVVSPLIALMQDQVAQLDARGVKAAFINSTLAAREIEQRWTDAEFGRYRLLYVAPERLQSDIFLARAERLNVTLLAVDEAHCISEWGHHFRPSYLQIAQARVHLGDPPTIAVTATATPEVRRDIVEHLALRDPEVIVKGFDRPNLVWSIFRAENKREKVLDVLRGVPGSGLLYAATRRAVEDWAGWLAQQGETVMAYHGGLAHEVREKAQHAWIESRVRLVVATNAFGMGIDKPDVRSVIHLDVPASLEAYYQEAGRAGRDGHPADCILLWQKRDAGLLAHFVEQITDPAEKERAWQRYHQIRSFAESKSCRHRQICTHFGETPKWRSCGACDVCGCEL